MALLPVYLTWLLIKEKNLLTACLPIHNLQTDFTHSALDKQIEEDLCLNSLNFQENCKKLFVSMWFRIATQRSSDRYCWN